MKKFEETVILRKTTRHMTSFTTYDLLTFWLGTYKYSLSCSLSAVPAPGQIAGPCTRTALTAKRPARIKLIISTLLCRY